MQTKALGKIFKNQNFQFGSECVKNCQLFYEGEGTTSIINSLIRIREHRSFCSRTCAAESEKQQCQSPPRTLGKRNDRLLPRFKKLAEKIRSDFGGRPYEHFDSKRDESGTNGVSYSHPSDPLQESSGTARIEKKGPPRVQKKHRRDGPRSRRPQTQTGHVRVKIYKSIPSAVSIDVESLCVQTKDIRKASDCKLLILLDPLFFLLFGLDVADQLAKLDRVELGLLLGVGHFHEGRRLFVRIPGQST